MIGAENDRSGGLSLFHTYADGPMPNMKLLGTTARMRSRSDAPRSLPSRYQHGNTWSEARRHITFVRLEAER